MDKRARLAEMNRREAEMLLEYGWYMHFVNAHDTIPELVNVHTHGLREGYNHPDLQIVVPLPPNVAGNILTTIADRVKRGDRFEAGQEYPEILQGYNVKLVDAREGNRAVLRVILPDKSGNLERDQIQGEFALQYEDL